MLLLLAVMCSVFAARVKAGSDKIVINEIKFGGSGNYIELYNKSDKAVDIGEWQLKKRTNKKEGSECTEDSIGVFLNDVVIPAHGYYLWANKKTDLDGVKPDISNSNTIASNNSVALFDENKNIIDQVAWGIDLIDPFVEKEPFVAYKEQPNRIERINFQDTDDNSKDFHFLNIGTPTASGCETNPEKCEIEKPPIVVDPKAKELVISELLPYPDSGQEEFIELYNGSDKDLDLSGWQLHDASKTGKYVFPAGALIEAKHYHVIYKTDFKFALNNSGDESVILLDPNGQEVSRVDYNGSKKGSSYGLDGSRWRWTKFVTPGEENKFGNEPYGSVDIDDDIYVKVYADFSISTGDADGDKVKVTWDFGDGHKSYLAKVRHKYVATGTYHGTVLISDGSEDVTKEFDVEVKKYPHPKVQIVEVKANPKGSDTDLETITVLNKSKKTVNLNGWSVASGAKKKLTNHPIKADVKIKKKKTKVITKEMSKFSLNNKKGKIELRYPDGKVASKAKYDHGKISIADDEIYQKVKGGWEWSGGTQEPIIKAQDTNNTQEPIANNQADVDAEPVAPEASVDEVEQQAILTPIEIPVQKYKIELAVANVSSEPQVLGAETVREDGDQYLFNSQSETSPHYAVTFFERIVAFFNSSFNLLLNKIF